MRQGTDDTETSTPPATSRRRFLTVAAAGTLAGVGGLTGAAARSQPETIRLDGVTSGWVGREPARIEAVTNPTLELEAGTDYRLTWKNVDGAPHNIKVLDGDDNTLERTDILAEKGATQTLEFTAREAMATYLCEVHPTSMRGPIGFGTSNETTTETETSDDGRKNDSYFDNGPSIRTETLVDGGLTAPTDFAQPPGERDRFYIVDQVGQVYTYEAGGRNRELFLDLADRLIDFDNLPDKKVIDERGLLGLTFHPNYRENGKFYVAYSAPPREGTPPNYTHTQVVSEFEATDDGTKALPETERALLEMPSPYYTHNGGALDFGPDDGFLYVSIGNGGGALQSPKQANDWFEPNYGGNGQDVGHNLLGSILRIDVDSRDGDKSYGIPEDNPLVGTEGLDEHYAWGFRNPWRVGFSGGRLMAADVGQSSYEEVNVVEKGKNYGWNVKEGTHCFSTEDADEERAECPDRTPESVRGGEALVDPVIEYPHPGVEGGPGAGIAVIGGYFYENARIPALDGKYVFGDYSTGKENPSGSLFASTPTDEGQWSTEEITIENSDDDALGAFLLCVGRDTDGELYALTTDNLGVKGETGAVHRLRPPKADTTALPETETPGRPPTATATAEPTATETRTATATRTSTPTSTATARRTATDTADATDAPDSNGSAESDEGSGFDRGSGPGFGVLAGLVGLAGIAARLLARRRER